MTIQIIGSRYQHNLLVNKPIINDNNKNDTVPHSKVN